MIRVDAPLCASAIKEASGKFGAECDVWVLDSVPSTNSWLLENGRPGSMGLCIAERQLLGKGRRGRQWQSDSGAFTCSIRVPLSVPLAEAGAFSLVVAVSLAEAIASLGVEGVGLKWPNDILHQWRKLAGILLEVGSSGERSVDLVVGAGVNWGPVAADVGQPVVDVQRLQPQLQADRNILAGRWLARLADYTSVFEQSGFSAFADSWRQYDQLMGEEVVVLRGRERTVGRVLAVEADGALRVDTASGPQVLYAGEVSLRRK